MSLALPDLVEEFDRHRTGICDLTAWRRLQIGLHLLVPTVVGRFNAAVAADRIPLPHLPLLRETAERQHLPRVGQPLTAWHGGDALPVPSRLLAPLTNTQAERLARIIGSQGLPHLLHLEQLYLTANLQLPLRSTALLHDSPETNLPVLSLTIRPQS